MQLITILGQTSSGKSDLAIDLAKHFTLIRKKACIVGCDSRQIYKGLNIGTGKIEGKWVYDKKLDNKLFKYKGVKHFMIDFVNPQDDYNLQNYISDFYDLMIEIEGQFDFVILVGGTGLYAKAINEKMNLGSVKSEFLSQYDQYKSTLQSQQVYKLQESANNFLIELNHSDYNNKVRLVSNLLKIHCEDNNWLEDSLYYAFEKQHYFAINISQDKLKSKIEARLINRFNQGLIDEIKKFEYLGHDKFMSLGLEYRLTWFFIQEKLSISELQINLLTENLQYAKRQLTWLKSQKNLIWIRSLKGIIDKIL